MVLDKLLHYKKVINIVYSRDKLKQIKFLITTSYWHKCNNFIDTEHDTKKTTHT